MAIYFKHDIEKRLQALEEHYAALKNALKGRVPIDGYASSFGIEENAFRESRVSVDFDEVLIRLDHFKSELAGIKALKSRAEKPSR